MYVLDTNVLSELRRPAKANPKVRAWAAGVSVAQFYISAITILEIELGALLVARKDARQGAHLRAWIDGEIRPRFEGRILPVDTATAQCCAKLHVPDRMAERDALIAATALVHGMKIVTRNAADFQAAGVDIFNPWG